MPSMPMLPLFALPSCQDYEVVELTALDTFVQAPPTEVDVLLVIDNSCSMSTHQEELGDNLAGFLSYFVEGNVDYHIGAITTDAMGDDAGVVLGEVLTPGTPDAEQVFAELTAVGTSGTSTEMGLQTSLMALTPPLSTTDNGVLLRDTAYLSIIYVTDEQDGSPGGVNDFINTFRDIKGQENRKAFNASALVVTDLDLCSTEQLSSLPSVGTRYIDVAEQTDGITANICETDFSEIVQELSLSTSRLEDIFYLSELPKASTLHVWVDDEEWPCEDGRWTYELAERYGQPTGAIVFDRAWLPWPDAVIDVDYKQGTGEADLFCTAEDTGP